MTKHWKTLVGGLAAAVALGAGSSAGASSPPSEPGSAGTITVSGSGTVTVEPDIATLNLGVQATEPTGEAAMAAVVAGSNALTEALTAAGIAAEDVQTSGLSLWNAFGPDGTTPSGYQASLNVNVVVRDIATVGEVVDAAQQAVGEGFTIGGVSFSFADPESVLEQARIDAVANARTIAGQYADAAGVTLGPIVSIVDSPSFVPVARAASAPMADQSLAISPGSLDLSAQITVTFSIG